MKRLVLSLAVLLTVAAPLAQGEGSREETRTTLRHEMLRLINRDRGLHGLPPVQLDVELSAVSDMYCQRQIANGTTGHFTTDGLAPYMRFSFAGVNDGISENAAAWSASYRFSDRSIHEMARRSQRAMMNERPPHDGHRRAILDPHATHVGIGLAWERGEFRMVQEFARRYVTWTRPLPRAATLHEAVSGGGKPRDGYRVETISVHHERFPESMPAHVANALTSYRLPQSRRDYLPRLKSYLRHHQGTFQFVTEEYSDGSRGDFNVGKDGAFNFTVPFRDGEGIYTVVVWVTKKGDRTPIPASNISIRVDKPVYSAAGVASAR